MINQIDIENFIEGQYRKDFQYSPFSERDQQYAKLYNDIPHEKMREMFIAMHAPGNTAAADGNAIMFRCLTGSDLGLDLCKK